MWLEVKARSTPHFPNKQITSPTSMVLPDVLLLMGAIRGSRPRPASAAAAGGGGGGGPASLPT
eukprot:2875630-Amphidinium_carterae.2